jgi:hypothetical protein
MKTVDEKIARLYKLLIEAKEIQSDIVSNHGKEINEGVRIEIVNVWNALNDCGTPLHRILNYRNINYETLKYNPSKVKI